MGFSVLILHLSEQFLLVWCESFGQVHLEGHYQVAGLSLVSIYGESLAPQSHFTEVLCQWLHLQSDGSRQGVDGSLASQQGGV